MRLAMLYSGGTGAVLAMHLAARAGHSIACMTSFHSVPVGSVFRPFLPVVSELSSRSMLVPWQPVHLSGSLRSEPLDLSLGLRELKRVFALDGVVAGFRVFSPGVAKFQFICQSQGLSLELPLVGVEPSRILSGALSRGFSMVPTRIRSNNGEQKFLGVELDRSFIPSLAVLPLDPFPIQNTLVVHGPGFGSRLCIRESTTHCTPEGCELEIGAVELAGRSLAAAGQGG